MMELGSQSAYRVLLIQDDPKQTELCTDLISAISKCEISVESDNDQVLELISRQIFNLVVVDCDHWNKPASSIALLESIKRLSPMTSVVMLATNARVEEAVAAIRLGAEDYLKKPFSLESFQLAVKRGLDRKLIFGENSGASTYINLVNSCQMISASLEQPRILSIVCSYVRREVNCDHAAIYRLEPNLLGEARPVLVEDAETSRRDRSIEQVVEIALHASSPLSKMLENDEIIRFVERGQLTPGLFVFRFKCVGSSEYFCVGLAPQPPVALEAFESRMKLLRAQIEVTGKNIEQYLGFQHLAYVDDATGLYNTRYLYNILDREISQAKVSGRSFAILFMDGDRFKSINDNYGHLSGTKLLYELGNHLKRYVREKDTVFRYGGDEFVAVLTNCDLETAKRVAERIRKSVEAHSFLASDGKNLKITVSIGVALFPDHADSVKAVIEAADHAMYAAKRTTRNSVFIAPLPHLPEPPDGGGERPTPQPVEKSTDLRPEPPAQVVRLTQGPSARARRKRSG